MNDYDELTDRFVAVWNETDPKQRRRRIRGLWNEDGVECTKQRESQGYAAREA